jgi:hypothetical protein
VELEQLLKAMSDYYLILLIWFLGPLVGYAVAKDHGLSRPGGALAGFILGPVLVLFLYALPPTLRKCPACDEWMSVKANVCPHCQRELIEKPAPAAIATSSARRKPS